MDGKLLRVNIRGKGGILSKLALQDSYQSRPGRSDITWGDGGGQEIWLDIKSDYAWPLHSTPEAEQ